jgi:hypothetical protein
VHPSPANSPPRSWPSRSAPASTLPSPGLRPRRLWSRRPAGWQSPAVLGVLAANSVAAEQFGDLAAGRFEVVGREGDLRRGRTGLDQGADGRDPVWAGVVRGRSPLPILAQSRGVLSQLVSPASMSAGRSGNGRAWADWLDLHSSGAADMPPCYDAELYSLPSRGGVPQRRPLRVPGSASCGCSGSFRPERRRRPRNPERWLARCRPLAGYGHGN